MKKVLFLASNPTGTPNLEINDEIRQARNSLQRSEFEIDTRQAVRYDDLRKALTQVKPRIVHFSGHGSGFQGLVLEDDEGQSRLISTKVLADLFGIPSICQNVECIVLNACFSEVQAKAICKHINYVIGMNREVRDDAAISFTKGFYDALGDGESIENAFQFGKNAFDEKLSNTTSNHRGMEVVTEASDTVDSVVQILKKDLPFVPFENGSEPKPFPILPVPSPSPSPITRQKFLRWVGVGGIGVIGVLGVKWLLIPQNHQLGWIRIGAIQNTSFKDGAHLVATSSQPVTIQPTVVPQNGSQVTIITGANVRDGAPEPPDYDPERKDKITVLIPGTRVVVMQKIAFPDPKHPDTIIVWAEVRLISN